MNAKKTIAALHNDNYVLKQALKEAQEAIERLQVGFERCNDEIHRRETFCLILLNDIKKCKTLKEFKPLRDFCTDLMKKREEAAKALEAK